MKKLIDIIDTTNEPNIIEQIMTLRFKFKSSVVLYGKRNSTGSPSANHIINESKGTAYCGYDNFLAEVSVVTSDDEMFKPDFCKKCLKAHDKEHLKTKYDIHN
jgi:hypothetical protein